MDPESISPWLRGLDTWEDADILDALWRGQAAAVAAVRAVQPALAAAARDVVGRLQAGGRLVLVGAGTSGELAALEAAEIPPTYGWPQARIICRTAGFRPVGRGVAEESATHAEAMMAELALSALDAVIAVSASGETIFTCAAAAQARARNALVVAVFNRAGARLGGIAHHPIHLATGPEIPAGSTRMNAGTGQKAALNLLGTLVMTRLGRVHDGLMVELTPDRPKFRTRATRIVGAIAACPLADAERCLLRAGGDIKLAILLARGCGEERAERLLEDCGRDLRRALARLE